MGTSGALAFREEIRRLKKAKNNAAADLLKKRLEALTSTDYTVLNTAMQTTYQKISLKLTGTQSNSGVKVTGKLKQIVQLEAALLQLLQNSWGGSFTPPSNVTDAILVLVYLDAIVEVFHAVVFQGADVYADPDHTEVIQMKTGNHYACLGYADYLLQAVYSWEGSQIPIPRPKKSNSEYYCFIDYVNNTNGLIN